MNELNFDPNTQQYHGMKVIIFNDGSLEVNDGRHVHQYELNDPDAFTFREYTGAETMHGKIFENVSRTELIWIISQGFSV